MQKDVFLWLQEWYTMHCNGDWEHGCGIHISTIDNPGWSVAITIAETELEDKKFEKIYIEKSEQDWIFCLVENGQFKGSCGPENLHEILNIFYEWAK